MLKVVSIHHVEMYLGNDFSYASTSKSILSMSHIRIDEIVRFPAGFIRVLSKMSVLGG